MSYLFEVWPYNRPARPRSADMVTEWSYAEVRHGVVQTSQCVSGFASRADAEHAARVATSPPCARCGTNEHVHVSAGSFGADCYCAECNTAWEQQL